MQVASLFDGMSVGRYALDKVGIKYDKYFASEIDKHAITVASKNYPDTVQLGSVTTVNSATIPKIDLLLGGSPCQGFSFSGKQLNFEDPRSKLFFDYVRILEELKPSYFLLENVKMKQEYQDVISAQLGVKPIKISSAYFSAQNRVRLYWTNIPVKGVPVLEKAPLLCDIIDPNTIHSEFVIPNDYFKAPDLYEFLKSKKRRVIFNYSSSGRGNGVVEYRFYEAIKAHTLTKTGYTKRSFTGVYDNITDTIRTLTPIEMERLQTLPSNYTAGVSTRQRGAMLGNGWTSAVIEHILEGLPLHWR